MDLTNCQITLTGLFGEISDARRLKIQQAIHGLFPTPLTTPATGILAFTNPMKQDALILGPSALNYTTAKLENLRLEVMRSFYGELFNQGLMPDTVTPSLEIGSIADAEKPLARFQQTAGAAFDAGFETSELIGMAVRKIYRHDDLVADVRLENNFQGLDRYHGSVRIESQIPHQWSTAFNKVEEYLKLAVEITKQLDRSLGIAEVSA